MSGKKLEIGKLDTNQLKELIFDSIRRVRDEVLVRPTVGEDCAVVDYGENSLVISTDPITGTSQEIGKLAVHINCNDIASNGIEPIGIMITLMVPPSTLEDEIKYIMKQASDEAAKINVEIIGGHTEVTDAVNKIIISATAIGMTKTDKVRNKEVIKPGYKIIMTKSAGLEGTGIIAYELEKELKSVIGIESLERAKKILDKVSVVREGVLAGKLGVTSLHDVTEGGLLGGIWELCAKEGLGCDIYEKDIYITKETKDICTYLNINPLRLISSGTMIMLVAPHISDVVVSKLKEEDIRCSVIGELTKGNIRLIKNNGDIELVKPPKGDELYKAI